MRGIKNLVIGLVLGFVLGFWLGVNIGRDRPLFSNPFHEVTMQEKLKSTGRDVGRGVGEAVEKGGRALQNSLNR